MTAETITEDSEALEENATKPETPPTNAALPKEILDIFQFLSLNNKIVFRSQQIDDPELQIVEKVQIAREIFQKNRQSFLTRFGNYLLESHLDSLERQVTSDNFPLKPDENDEEIRLMLRTYQRKLVTRNRDVKNRRYAAMQRLIKDGEYFSEQEMMKRAPELYQELIGQYLSEMEKQQRDSYDVKNTTFSGILLHSMEQQEMKEVLQNASKRLKPSHSSAKETVSGDSDSDSSSELINKSGTEPATSWEDDVPVSCRQLWGNFDNEVIACSSTSNTTKPELRCKRFQSKNLNETFITAGERDLLRQEFLGIMHEQFLAGKDPDFDYSLVDDNTELDDLHLLNQDKEDAYFEASDDDDLDTNIVNTAPDIERTSSDEESEDELDVYMNHLSRHHSLQL